ncbi:zinc-ribbon domain-containing protein [Methanobacterium sp. BAmetb5]|uniref:zinc-ribbon domain-containing protein n=1 Tax=Methanobacterium sp. BAmetb5 TaxID=2025351 RepID=UPI000E8CF129|nr:zinc-ribbon domain-containing protein [Methanobacterium sp. BAmetb5]AXV40263.1 MAG: hypothetical protein CIT02_08000 [Methanobacterium sp. BAmetb5]
MSQNKISSTNMIFCSGCGAKNPSNALFCMECGTKMVHPSKNGRKDSSEEEMKSLGLAPAESYALLHIDSPNISTDNTHGKELLKLTMKDLLARKVIKINSREEKGFLSKKMVNRVSKGENFNQDLKPYQEVFTKPLGKNQELEIKKYFKNILKQFRSRLTGPLFYKYKNDFVMPVLIEKGYVILTEKKGMLSNAKYALTEEGIRVKDRINDLFIDSDNLLNWMDSNPEKAKAFLSAVGTHIFILPYDRGQLQLLKNRLAHVKTKTSKFYPYLLYPLSVGMGMKLGRNSSKKKEDLLDFDNTVDLFDWDVLDAFEDFEMDSFDDVFDSFEDICDSFEVADGNDW